MTKEERTIDKTAAADTHKTDDSTVTAQERNLDTPTASEINTAAELPAANSAQGEKGDDFQAPPESGPTTTTQPLAPETEPDPSSLNVLTEINQRLGMLQELLEKQNAHDQESRPLQSESAQTDQRLTDLHELFDKQIVRNQNQKQMFDTIYREMTSYKEDALLEAYHKPIIHNLIQLYDNLELVESQLEGIRKTFESLGSQSEDVSGTFESFGIWFGGLRGREREELLKKLRPSDEKLATELEGFGKVSEDKSSPSQANTELTDEPAQFQKRQEDRLYLSQLKGELSQFQENLENVRYELEEVLYRMDVTPYEEHPEKLDQKLHKTLKTTPTDDPDKDREVVEIHKTGFYWRERVFRPEEVTIFRYAQPAGKPEETVVENPTDEKGDETDG